jgi:hypothetical protein
MHFRLNPHHREREPRSDIRGRQLIHAGKDFGPRPLVHSIQTCVSRNPHDGHAPKEIGPTIHGDAVADWITIREEFAYQRLIQDRRKGRARPVSIIEGPSSDDRNS